MTYVIPGCYSLEFMASHLEYTHSAGHLGEFVRKTYLNPQKLDGFNGCR